jgi:hypothetical protein
MSNVKIEEETQRIRANSQCADFFDDLIKVIVKSHIVILTCSAKDSKLITEKFHESVDIKLFIHKCYIEIAKIFYNNPKLFYSSESLATKNSTQAIKCDRETIFNNIRAGIKSALIQTLPMRQIIDEYLNTSVADVNKQYMDNIKQMISHDMGKIDKDNVNLLENSEQKNTLLQETKQHDDFDLDLKDFIFGRKIVDTIENTKNEQPKSEFDKSTFEKHVSPSKNEILSVSSNTRKIKENDINANINAIFNKSTVTKKNDNDTILTNAIKLANKQEKEYHQEQKEEPKEEQKEKQKEEQKEEPKEDTKERQEENPYEINIDRTLKRNNDNHFSD